MDRLGEIQKGLSHIRLAWKPTLWLNTGLPALNTVLGHPVRGIAYGRHIEISGWESMGKSAIMTTIAAMAQRDGAHVVWLDVEFSFAADWGLKRGLLACPKCGGAGLVTRAVKATKKSPASEMREDCPDCGGVEALTCVLDNSEITVIQPYVGYFTHKDKKTGRPCVFIFVQRRLCQVPRRCP